MVAPKGTAEVSKQTESAVSETTETILSSPGLPSNPDSLRTAGDMSSMGSDGTLQTVVSGAAANDREDPSRELSNFNSDGAAQLDKTVVGTGPELEDFVETINHTSKSGSTAGAGAIGKVIGDYEVQQELGRGGMGVVYKARHRILKRTVALKMILAGAHTTGAALQRFLAEARAVAHLQHPGIVQIFDMGQHEGLPWFSLEFVDGSDLQKALNGKPREARSAAALVEAICRTMQYAHSHGILHRDLKPANILLDAAGNPKVTDFGLAKEVDSENSAATRDGTIMGSPSYMPPEQARGQIAEVTPKSDQYSMGAVLYQLLTARPPFITDRPLETVMQVINNEPVAPRQLQPAIPADLETICLKALQKDPAQRYDSCEAMADDLRRFLNGEPILARPVSWLQRTWRWCRRNPRIAVPSAAAGFSICLTAVIASWAWAATSAQAKQIADEKQKVEVQRDEADRQRAIANQQQKLAEEKEELARKQAVLALQNIQFVLTQTDTALKQRPGMNELRIAILEAVAKKWNELDVELTGGIRGEAIPTLMAIRQQIGIAFFEMDQLVKATTEFSSLYDLSAERIAIRGRTDATRTNRARIALVWAPVKSRLESNPDAAVKLLAEAEALVRECLTDPRPEKTSPSPEDIRELLAGILQNKGVELLHQGKLAETEACFSEGLSLMAEVLTSIRSAPGFDQLSDDEKDTRTASRQISHDKAAVGLAYLNMRLGKTDQSIANYDAAIAARREIFERRKTVPVLRQELAGYLGTYSQALIWIGRLDVAGTHAQESIDHFEALFQQDPQKAEYKRQLATGLYRLATIRDLQGHSAESTSLIERCRVFRQELATQSPDEKNNINLMLVLARCGRSEDAMKIIDELTALQTKNGERHLECSRSLAQLARTAEPDAKPALLNRALDELERAVDEGYADPFRMRSEPDLELLRGDPRFIAAVARLEAAK
jgi:serine/threonine protein kinase/tetratricopeptide (TPR) repeat protein